MRLIVILADLIVAALLIDSALTDRTLKQVATGQAGATSSSDAGSWTGGVQITDAQAATAATALGASAAAAADSGSTVMMPSNLANAPAKVQGMYAQAMKLVGRPYAWAGGHGADWLNAAAYDCSGFVSSLLGSVGIIKSPLNTTGLGQSSALSSGAGQYVTIYDRTDEGSGQDHVIIDIAGHWFESGGNSAYNKSANDGVAAIAQPPSSYLATFNRILHPNGL